MIAAIAMFSMMSRTRVRLCVNAAIVGATRLDQLVSGSMLGIVLAAATIPSRANRRSADPR